MAESKGYSLVIVHGLLIAMASITVVNHELQGTGSIVVALGFSFSGACGIFLNQGWNPCLLRWQVDSLPLNHQESQGEILV